MAIFKKTVPVAKPVTKTVAKPATKVAAKNDGFQVVSVDSIEFLAGGGGGGKPMDPAVANLIEKALALEIGQAFKIPTAMRAERPIVNSTTGVESILYTYQGAQSLGKKAAQNGMRFRTRRDKAGNLWLFAVEPLTEEQLNARAEKKAAKQG